MDIQSKIILVSGPTASGKSHLAVKLAKKVGGEIINADSMQVYKQFKILTARPNKNEKQNSQLIVVQKYQIPFLKCPINMMETNHTHPSNLPNQPHC